MVCRRRLLNFAFPHHWTFFLELRFMIIPAFSGEECLLYATLSIILPSNLTVRARVPVFPGYCGLPAASIKQPSDSFYPQIVFQYSLTFSVLAIICSSVATDAPSNQLIG